MKAISILTPRSDTFSNPNIVYLLERLIALNYKILFFGFEKDSIPVEIKKQISFFEMPFNFYGLPKRPFIYFKIIRQYIDLFILFKIKFKVNTMICIDPMGLVVGGRINRLLKLNLIYYSFEIFLEEDFYVSRKKILKKLELKYSRLPDLVVIQDGRRELLLKKVNDFKESVRFIHIPVAPKPLEIKENGFDIYSMLGIPREKKIVIYSGTLSGWSGINELLNLFPDKWNNDYWLIVHSHHILSGDDELKRKFDEFKSKNFNVTLHNEPFYDYTKYSSFLSKCHIGIAAYFRDLTDIFAGRNMEVIGLSSGKFSIYMMLGIPTIATYNETYDELNRKYSFGELIESMEEVPHAIERVQKDYQSRVKGCKELYKNELNPEGRFNKLLGYIEDTIK